MDLRIMLQALMTIIIEFKYETLKLLSTILVLLLQLMYTLYKCQFYINIYRYFYVQAA